MKACFHRLPTTLPSSDESTLNTGKDMLPSVPFHVIEFIIVAVSVEICLYLRMRLKKLSSLFQLPTGLMSMAFTLHVFAQQVFKFILTVYVIRKVRICKVIWHQPQPDHVRRVLWMLPGHRLNMLSNQLRIKPSGHIPTKANRRLSFIKV